MIIFLYGEDAYRSRQKLREIIEQYKKVHKAGLNLNYLDYSKGGDSISFSDFKDNTRQASMFKEKKMYILTNIFSNSGFREEFLEEAKNLIKSDDIIVVYEPGKCDERISLFKLLKEKAKSQKFDQLSGQKLKSWVKKEFQNNKTQIEDRVLEKLIEYVGSDLWQMHNEINKLVNFREDKPIRAEDVSLMVRPKIETDIFKTIDAIAKKDKKQALNLLHSHIEKGDSPLYLLSMITFQFRNLLIVRDLMDKYNPYESIVRKSGLHPFVVKKTYFQAEKFSLPELKKIYQKIFQVDLDIKTGKTDAETALDLLVAEI